MPGLRNRKMRKYVVKFGLAHKGPRLDYQSIFELLDVRSLEVAIRDDGVVCIMLTTDRCRTIENVKRVVANYNESPTAEQDGGMDLEPFSDNCDDTILTFNRDALYHSHPFYDQIKIVREQSLMSGDDSNYYMLGCNQKKKTLAKNSTKKGVASKLEEQIEPETKSEWSGFHKLLLRCKFDFSVSDL